MLSSNRKKTTGPRRAPPWLRHESADRGDYLIVASSNSQQPSVPVAVSNGPESGSAGWKRSWFGPPEEQRSIEERLDSVARYMPFFTGALTLNVSISYVSAFGSDWPWVCSFF